MMWLSTWLVAAAGSNVSHWTVVVGRISDDGAGTSGPIDRGSADTLGHAGHHAATAASAVSHGRHARTASRKAGREGPSEARFVACMPLDRSSAGSRIC